MVRSDAEIQSLGRLVTHEAFMARLDAYELLCDDQNIGNAPRRPNGGGTYLRNTDFAYWRAATLDFCHMSEAKCRELYPGFDASRAATLGLVRRHISDGGEITVLNGHLVHAFLGYLLERDLPEHVFFQIGADMQGGELSVRFNINLFFGFIIK